MKGMSRTAAVILFIFLVPQNHVYSFDGKRRGSVFQLGLGTGNTSVFSGEEATENYSRFGLGINMAFGYAFTDRFLLSLVINSNVFPGEVSSVWQEWQDKMSGDDLGALGAKIASPFVFVFAPIFRSHSLYGAGEFTWFLKEQAPSLLFDGAAGFGMLYDKNHDMVYGGFGLSAGTGYEFARRAALNLDIIYSLTEYDVSGLTFLLSLKLYIY